jgi:hypothetical protein
MLTRHLNGIRTDNRPSNLAWGTPLENAADTARHGAQIQGERHYRATFTEREVLQLRAKAASGLTIRQLAELYGRPLETVRQIVSRYTWRHI